MLSITVFDTPEFDRTVTVGTNGQIQLSYLQAPLAASGETAAAVDVELKQAIRSANLLVDPQAAVAVVLAQSHVVTVGGAVKVPTALYLTRPISLLDAVVRAGGVDLQQAGANVELTDARGVKRVISYPDVASGQAANNPELVGGEHVEVTPGGEVFVSGAVVQPGAFPITASTPMTASKAVAMARGCLTVGAKPSKAAISRTLPDGTVQNIPVDLTKIASLKEPDVPLQANDILYVPQDAKARMGMAALTAAVSSISYGMALLMSR